MSEAYKTVQLARSEKRLRAKEVMEALFEDMIYLRGDRCFGDSKTVLGGVATFENRPITFLGIQKGRNIDESVETNFGMPLPEGYRKAARLMRQAEKFGRAIITFVDTPGAYPGIEAEERGQFEAISECIALMGSLKVAVISFIIGEGGSGGALAFAVGNKVYMFKNAIYSVLSPEGFASIMYKDASLADKASEIMKLTAEDLKTFGIIDGIVREDERQNPDFEQMKKLIGDELNRLDLLTLEQIVKERHEKFMKMGR